MYVNSSSSSNDSLLHLNPSSNNHFSFDTECFTTRPGSIISTMFFISVIFLLLPLCIFIIYHGLQQWRLNGSTSSAATMSHSDSFTYNMVIMEMIYVFGCILLICGIYTDHLYLITVAYVLRCFSWSSEIYFHVLTCVERYLAVVHPITYLSLRKERGIRIRNISITCVWLLSVVGTSLLVTIDVFIVVYFCVMLLSLAIISFCSVSVLCVLIRPGPGEQGGDRKSIDQSKLRAFYTIMVILGVLILRFTWNVVWGAIYILGRVECALRIAGLWLNLPSTLVLPLLFLHRAGKLMCCKNKI